jgi:putative ABC transport system permease protein
MLKFIMHGLLARKFRLVATALAVTLGVAFMAGTLVLTDTFGQTFNDLSAGVYKGTDAVVRATAVFNGPQFTGEQRPFVDASLASTLSRVPGVSAAEGSVMGYTRLIGKDGKALGNPVNGAPTLGGNWNQVTALNPWHLVAGHAPQAAGQVVIDSKSARDGRLQVGDFTTVLVKGPPQRVQVVGIIGFGTTDSPGGASVVLFTTPAAQQLVAAPGKYSSILFVAKPGVSQQQLVSNLKQAIPHGTEAITGAALTKELQDQFAKVLSFFNTFLLIFAVVALLVGAFMIFNTFSITVAQRTRENGLLRALGASKRQVLGAVLLEAVVVGIIASLIGLAAGVAVAIGLKAMLSALGMASLPTSGIVFTARTALIAGLAGLAVTILAAVSPARKAAKVTPVAAMQDVTVGSTGYGSKERVMVGTAILVLGVAALFTGLFTNVSSRVLVVGAGALLVFFGVSVLGRTVSLPLSRVVGAPLPQLRGVTGKLARQNAMRNPKRTAASASALMIGVGLVGFFTILASSSTASVNSAIDRAVAGDIVIDSGGGLMGGVDPGLARQLGKLPQVQAATGVAIGLAEVNGKVEQLSAVDPAAASKIFNVSPVQGSVAGLGRNGIAVYKDVATAEHLKLGSTVSALFKDTGPQKLTVALIYGEATGAPAPRYFMGNQAFNANFPVRYDTRVFVKKAPGVSTAAALAAVRAVATRYSGTTVMDQAAFKADQAKPMQQQLMLVYVLLALAILIALLGIGNTLALSIFERTRELGVMRAVGMTRHQLRAMIRWESVIIALQGTVLGLLIGVFFGWALVLAMKSQGITEFSVPVLSLVIVVVLAALAGAAAAIWPSRRAAKLNILRAIVTE